MVAEEVSPVIEQPGEVAEEAAIAPVEPEENMSFAQAWAKYESELEEGEEGPEDERTRKKKTDKDKRRVLEFDEKLGQVVAKRKRKGGRSGEEWEETPEE